MHAYYQHIGLSLSVREILQGLEADDLILVHIDCLRSGAQKLEAAAGFQLDRWPHSDSWDDPPLCQDFLPKAMGIVLASILAAELAWPHQGQGA